MTAAEKWNLVSVNDYIAGELESPQKHEYVGGIVHAMAGATNQHNAVASNILGSWFGQLRGKPCQAFNSDTKVRIQFAFGTRFYYPDAMVTCDLNPGSDSFQDNPKVIAEVLSDSTRRTDEEEKKDAYLMISSLEVYLMFEPSEAAVIVHRRTADGFQREVVTGIDSVIPLPEIKCELPLAEVYDGLDLRA
ncbi:MAG: Uma2 family endonuclease [Verrucomicrobiales bacterium]|jgi:Uma2 family endonuclease